MAMTPVLLPVLSLVKTVGAIVGLAVLLGVGSADGKTVGSADGGVVGTEVGTLWRSRCGRPRARAAAQGFGLTSSETHWS